MSPQDFKLAVLLLSAMAANLALYLASHLGPEALGPPLDGGRSWGGRRLVGDGRRLLGLSTALLAACSVASLLGDVWTGVMAAIGVDLGTVVHSFIKRRRGLSRGELHLPWDHLDYIVGALVAYSWHQPLGFITFLICTALGGAVHWCASCLLRPLLDRRHD